MSRNPRPRDCHPSARPSVFSKFVTGRVGSSEDASAVKRSDFIRNANRPIIF